MSSAARSSFENPEVITVSEFMRSANQVFEKGTLPPPEKFKAIIEKVVNECAGDDWELRGRFIERAVNNLRVLREARKQCLLNQKRKAEEAAIRDISATTHSNEADEMEK